MPIASNITAGLYRFCDASKWQGDMDWTKTSKRLDFAYAKMSQGVYLDPQWDNNWKECQQIGFPLGAYFYHDTSVSWQKQVDFYLEKFVKDGVKLYPMVDLEMINPLPKVVDILSMLSDIMEELNVFPIIYSGPSYIMRFLTLPDFSQFPLLIAHYSTDKRWPLSAPRVPLPWFPLDFWGWQFSADGNNQGSYYGSTANKAIDLDVAWSIPWMPNEQ